MITSTLQTVEIYKKVGWSGPAFGAFAIHTWYFTEHNQTCTRKYGRLAGQLIEK